MIWALRAYHWMMKYFAPLVGAVVVSITLIGFIPFAAASNWVVSHWIPSTRFIWDIVLSNFGFTQATASEKDALTLLVFFTPIGLSSIFLKNRVDSDTPKDSGIFQTFFAVIIGALVMLIMSHGARHEALSIIQISDRQFREVDFFSIYYNLSLSFVNILIVLAGMSLLGFYALLHSETGKFLERLKLKRSAALFNMMRDIYDEDRAAVHGRFFISNISYGLIGCIIIYIPIIFISIQQSWIVFICLILTSSIIASAALRRPKLILMMMAFILLILTVHLIYENGIPLVHQIESMRERQ